MNRHRGQMPLAPTPQHPALPSSQAPSILVLYRAPSGPPDASATRQNVLAVGHALSSAAWDGSDATLVVGPGPNPFLAVIGCFNESTQARIDALRGQLRGMDGPARYVSYSAAEADCERLAAALLERWDRPELQQFSYLAIPRGGLIVLGMLAYLLDLPASALVGTKASNRPLVVVDDCALSGARLRSFLEVHRHRSVVCAHLYSHPDLRAAVEARESHVVACIAARNLRDEAPDQLGDAYDSWRERWRQRSPDAYWIGRTEPLCFAWNEPDLSIWNPVSGEVEPGWRLVPGDACLKNRVGAAGHRIPVEIQPAGKGPLAPADHVVFGTLAGTLVVGNVESGQAVALDDVAADMWRTIMAEGDEDAAVAALAGSYDAEVETLRADLEQFVAEASALGLLVRHPGTHEA